jgi:death on curing protein
MKEISIQEVEYLAHDLAKKTMKWNEPIPEFNTRFPHKLESCLRTPFTRFGGKNLYKGLTEKAAILFYLMIKNHPFQNGNKRIAMTTLFVFLYKNKKWLEVDNQRLYNFAKWVAASDPAVKEQTVKATAEFLKKYSVSVKNQF